MTDSEKKTRCPVLKSECPVDAQLFVLEARVAVLEVGQPSAVARERERCARLVGSLLDFMVNERNVAFPAEDIVKALRGIEQAIRNGRMELLDWGAKGASR